MRITDARTGHRTEIHPHRAGLLRVTVQAGQPGRPFELADLRALLTADVLARIAELQGLQVITRLSLPDAPAEQIEALLRKAARLGIHPPAGTTAYPDPAADLHVTAHPHPDIPPVPLMTVGRVLAPRAGEWDAEAAEPGAAGPAEPDPLAVRLALLGHAYRAPARLTGQDLTDARATLARWRSLVAELAREPSRPLVAEAARTAFDGLADDLDTAPALRALHVLESRTDLPAGARFETFLRVDRVLGLELERDIGRGPRQLPGEPVRPGA
ncbi:hypothetical protein F7Q99_31735 [Streptomyces kaniharaensis]|uniref:Uncharacterized protein n=1 Tax=Streptomyces kaniharaensis TaxID=212423 RepID=A0A6N7L1Q6_9ACTN|nr:hypothetical protein [Streptomyces kaniharaensis]MQS16637.1 hypothetical protein [Streptomyces kaniharaensis]